MRFIFHLLLGGLLLGACDKDPPPPAAPASAPASTAAPEPNDVVDVGFSEIYQVFLYRTLNTQTKAERWASQYKNRWIRWTGQLAAFSGSGLKIRHIQSTITFDVSLVVNEPQRSQLKRQLQVGGYYTYMGRLDRFDDLFRTLYLDQGVVLNPSGGSVAGHLVPLPAKLKPATEASPPTASPGHPRPPRAPRPAPPPPTIAPARSPSPGAQP